MFFVFREANGSRQVGLALGKTTEESPYILYRKDEGEYEIAPYTGEQRIDKAAPDLSRPSVLHNSLAVLKGYLLADIYGAYTPADDHLGTLCEFAAFLAEKRERERAEAEEERRRERLAQGLPLGVGYREEQPADAPVPPESYDGEGLEVDGSPQSITL